VRDELAVARGRWNEGGNPPLIAPQGTEPMSRLRVLLVPLVIGCVASPAPAGIFSRSKPKANPAERVPELLIQLKTDKDEAKRAAAAEELRQFDHKAFPEVLTALADALAKDASTSVRSEAATTLGKVRPVSQQAGYALEQAVANDGSMRVRMAARQALWQYQLVGYRSGKPAEMPARPAEPTVSAPPGPSTPATRTAQRVATGPFRETPEPPLADPVIPPAAIATAPPAQRVPALAPLVPVTTPKLAKPPAVPAANRKPAQPSAPPAQPKNDGPELPF
jgi:hypothetical protein